MAEDLVGRVLGGRYRVVRALGEGGMGAVYEAVQEPLGRRVAVKVLADELRGEALFLERFRREAEAAGRLLHPHIVQVTDFVQAEGEPSFLVMELLEGEPLLALLRRGRLEPSRACRIAVQLLAALEAAHAAGIVHRDLKPANVFLVSLAAGVEYVKLLDFGVAKLKESDGYTRLTQTGVLIGTPRYASPEQAAGSRSIDARTDLYSAGCLLYAMLAGRPLFISQGAQLLVEIADSAPPDLRTLVPCLDPRLAAIVSRAMAKRPDARFASAREMGDALAPWTHPAAPAPAAHAQPAAEPTSVTTARGAADLDSTARPVATPAPPTTPSIPSTKPQMHAVQVPGPSGGLAWGAPPPAPWASGPPAPAVTAPRRSWLPLMIAGVLALALVAAGAALVAWAFLVSSEGSSSRVGIAASPERGPPPAPAAPAPSEPPIEISRAAQRLGPECAEWERAACTCGLARDPNGCSSARETLARGEMWVGTVYQERSRNFCREHREALRPECP